MNLLISEHKSDDGLRTSMVFSRSSEFRVVCLESYFETQKEFYFKTLQEAEDCAEEWVLDV